MTISATNWATSASTDHASTRDTRADNEHAQEFAGMLAGATQTPVQKLEPKKTHEGTSELDGPQDGEEAVDDDTKTGTPDSTVATAAANDATPVKTLHAPTAEIIQATAALDPELQAKLARVMSRVRDETGHEVKVAETYRTQDRQNVLFAQGRETPGSVVTWTRNSKHTQGRAVDLVLDGGTAGNAAYASLQRIAQEEGLRTLGARDPGHVELPGRGANLTGKPMLTAKAALPENATASVVAKATDVTPMISVAPADASGPGQVSVARLAQVAQVTQVSVDRPAQVARVASVARVQSSPADESVNGLPSTRGAKGAQTGQGVQNAIDDTKESSKRFSGDSSDQGSKGDQRGGYGTLAAAVALRDTSAAQANVGGVTASHGVSSADRAEAIAALQDAPARPLSQITMAVDAGNGTTDRIQVALRGSSLNATIDTGDAQRAQAMHSRSDELVRALSRDGIDVESLRVRGVAGAIVTGAASSSHSSNESHTGSRFDRQSPWQQQQDRQRSQEDRQQQQQRNQRGEQGK